MKYDFNKIRDRRKLIGITQQQLAFKSGLSITTVTLVENGKKVPKLDTAARIAKSLGVGLDFFFVK